MNGSRTYYTGFMLVQRQDSGFLFASPTEIAHPSLVEDRAFLKETATSLLLPISLTTVQLRRIPTSLNTVDNNRQFWASSPHWFFSTHLRKLNTFRTSTTTGSNFGNRDISILESRASTWPHPSSTRGPCGRRCHLWANLSSFIFRITC